MMIVYNPRSSQFGRVRDEVLAKARKLKGWTVGKFEVADTDVDDNARRLAKVLADGDLVVAAGGDGTATIAFNGMMLTGASLVRLGVLAYGNFNDMARSFGMMSFEEVVVAKETAVWGIECLVNGERWRWGLGYFTVGLFAEATAVFDDDEYRKKLQTGRKKAVFSWGILARWYFRNRRRGFLPSFRVNDVPMAAGTTDYVAVNGRSMAQVMRGAWWFLRERGFLSETARLRSFWRLFGLMARSILVRVPGKETAGDVLKFGRPGTVMIQSEGEYRRFEKVRTIEIRKAERPIMAVVRRRA